MGETLTRRVGFLPVWAWAALGTLILIVYLTYRRKQQMNAQALAAQNQASGLSSNTQVPISNLTTQAQPMPIQMGDMFVNVPGGGSTNSQTPGCTPGSPLCRPAGGTTMQPANTPGAPPAPVVPGQAAA